MRIFLSYSTPDIHLVYQIANHLQQHAEVLANRRGASRDLRRAVHLYRLAARQGRSNAAYNLGLYYSEGRGVRRSIRTARRWYQKAAALGDRDARRILRTLGRTPNHGFQRTALRAAAEAGR